MKKEIIEAAGYCVQCNAPLYDCRDCGAGDPLKFAKAIVDHHDKYRWHDLRKNPDDLPTEYGEDYLTAEKWNDGDITYITANKPYIDAHSPKAEPYMRTIIAWREIEPFESSDHCPLDYHGGDC